MIDKAVVTYLKRHENDHPEREELAKKIAGDLKKDINCDLVNLANTGPDDDYRGLIIGVGGDGVFLGNTHTFRHDDNEFILVGTKGRSTAHYAETNFKKYEKDLEKIFAGDYNIKEATRIVAECPDYKTWNLINEAAFLPSQPGRTFNYELDLETDHFYKKFYGSCTNLLFAAPCGSDAWSASAGGAVVRDQKRIVITPESPVYSVIGDPKNRINSEKDSENLLKSQVVPSDSRIELKLLIPTTLVEDGRYWLRQEFEPDTIFQIKEGQPVKMIELDKAYK